MGTMQNANVGRNSALSMFFPRCLPFPRCGLVSVTAAHPLWTRPRTVKFRFGGWRVGIRDPPKPVRRELSSSDPWGPTPAKSWPSSSDPYPPMPPPVVAPLVGRSVCFCEKRSTRSAKPPRSSRHRIVTRANLKPGLEHTSLQSPFLVPSRSIKPLRSTAILRLRRRCSTAESRRGILMEGRGGAPIALL